MKAPGIALPRTGMQGTVQAPMVAQIMAAQIKASLIAGSGQATQGRQRIPPQQTERNKNPGQPMLDESAGPDLFVPQVVLVRLCACGAEGICQTLCGKACSACGTSLRRTQCRVARLYGGGARQRRQHIRHEHDHHEHRKRDAVDGEALVRERGDELEESDDHHIAHDE